MSCPTCDHTMAKIASDVLTGGEDLRVYQCPRCGTTKIEDANNPDEPRWHVPKLVERCREFAQKMNLGPLSNSIAVDEWRRLGIAESIHPPEERKTT